MEAGDEEKQTPEEYGASGFWVGGFERLGVEVECIFNWYWLAGLCRREGIELVLGHALASADLQAAVEALIDVLGIEVAYADPGVGAFGLVNAVMPIGETHLEVVSPVRDDAAVKRWIARRGGDAG